MWKKGTSLPFILCDVIIRDSAATVEIVTLTGYTLKIYRCLSFFFGRSTMHTNDICPPCWERRRNWITSSGFLLVKMLRIQSSRSWAQRDRSTKGTNTCTSIAWQNFNKVRRIIITLNLAEVVIKVLKWLCITMSSLSLFGGFWS